MQKLSFTAHALSPGEDPIKEKQLALQWWTVRYCCESFWILDQSLKQAPDPEEGAKKVPF